MAKEVTVLSLEGGGVRCVRLAESGGAYARQAVFDGTADAGMDAGGRGGAGTDGRDGSQGRDGAGADGRGGSQERGGAGADGRGGAGAEDAINCVPPEEERAADVLTGAFADAAAALKTRTFVVSVPLSRLLVTVVRVPVEARDDLEEAAQKAVEAISPFPDEPLAVGTDVVAETDAEVVAVAAALPAAAAQDVTEALAAAKVYAVRTDATALGRLRAFWPHIVAKEGVRRRLVLMGYDGAWDVLVMDDGAPVFLRGLGALPAPEDLTREVTLSLLQCDAPGGAPAVGDVVVLTEDAAGADVLERLAAFGPVRAVATGGAGGDPFDAAEGVALRTAEGATFDVTPAAWRDALREARFKKRLTVGLAAAAAVWLAVMGVFFGVPAVYGQMTAAQNAKCRQHRRAYAAAKSVQTKLEMVKGYADRAHGALMMLKHISDELPEGTKLREYRYARGESVFVQGEVEQDTIAYAYKNALHALQNEDGGKLFPGGVDLSGLQRNKFKIDASLKEPDDDAPVRGAPAGGRRRAR